MSRRANVVYGLNAALAVAAHRPEAIRRVLYHRRHRVVLGPLLKEMAARRRPYREQTAEELAAAAKSDHHEGVVLLADPLPLLALDALGPRLPADAVVIALDGVGNPHNLGAILRSAAWFGVAGVIFPRLEHQASLSPAATRVAQGGAEVVPCCAVDDLPAALQSLAEHGFTVVGADQRANASAFARPLPRPICVVLGSEAEGLSRETRAACRFRVRIPGVAGVESLNVAVSASILMAAAFAG